MGEHWFLLTLVVSGATGFLTTTIAAIVMMFRVRGVLREEIHQGVNLSLTNHGAELVKGIVHTAVLDALDTHIVRCPMRDRVEALERERLELYRMTGKSP